LVSSKPWSSTLRGWRGPPPAAEKKGVILEGLDFQELARAIAPLGHQSRTLMLDEPDPGLLERLALLWDLEDSFQPASSTPWVPVHKAPLAAPPLGSASLSPPSLNRPQPRPPVRGPEPIPQTGHQPLPLAKTFSPAPAPVVERKPAPPVLVPGGAKPEPLAAKSLDSLHFRVRECSWCGLCESRRQVVFGQGNQRAFLVVVGDQPTRDEDQRGLTFLGERGDFLAKMLLALGLTKDSAYLTHLVKCRPDGDRAAKREEISACTAIFGKQLELLWPTLGQTPGNGEAGPEPEKPAPKLILALGHSTLLSLVPEAKDWQNSRARVFFYQGASVMGLDAPEQVLANKETLVPRLWDDLRRVRQELLRQRVT